VAGHDHLAHGAARVVAHERDVVEVERVEQVGHHPGQAGQVERGARRDGRGMAPQRQVGGDDPVAVGEQRDVVVPQVAVDERPVHEDLRRPVPCLAHPDRTGGEVDGVFGDRAVHGGPLGCSDCYMAGCHVDVASAT
jgi:hypothetical protein